MISRWIFLPDGLLYWGRQVPANDAAAHYCRAGTSVSGHIRFHGSTDVSRLHARERKVGFVFQLTMRCFAI